MSAAREAGARAAKEEMNRRISAYPPHVTFDDLMRKNRRQSLFLMVVMVGLAVTLGGVMASLVAAYVGAADFESFIPSILIGAGVGAGLAILVSLWSWFGGASAILRMSGAQELTKNEDPQLWNVVEEMSIASGLPMPRVYMINDNAMNAFATGRDPQHGVVAVTKGLRERLNRDELQGVIAHEIAHIRHLDIRFSMLMATMVGLIVFMSDAFLRTMWFRGAGRRHGRGYGSGGFRGSRGGGGGGGKGGGAVIIIFIVLMVVAMLLAIIAPILARLIQMSYSRQREYLADAGAVELTRNPHGLASALQKLADDQEPLVDTANRGTAHMYIVNPLRKMRESHQSINSAFSSHPPVKERIARLMALTR